MNYLHIFAMLARWPVKHDFTNSKGMQAYLRRVIYCTEREMKRFYYFFLSSARLSRPIITII